jgi:penicillin-binding protein 1A
MGKIINISVKILTFLLILSVITIFSALWYFSTGLPDYKKLSDYQPPISSRVYSKDGRLIAEYAIEKRLFIPYDSIPKKIINSFLSAEDKNFFNHPGIDAKGIMRASIKNFKNIANEKRLEGASTITQQVAKNFLLSNEVSIKRKIKEAILAFRIEKAYSKKRILELYLNQIYLGQGTYGIAAASLEYFDKAVKDLDYSEAALLAALPKAPSKYNPFRYQAEAKFRRNLVLKNLKENNFINEDQFTKLKKKDINLKKRKIEILNEANSYTEEVRRIIKKKYGFEKLYTQGLTIKTPLNIDYQIYAIESLRAGIESYDRRHGWRGPITNKLNDDKWKEKVEKIKLDPTLKWQIAEINEVFEEELKITTLNKKNYFLKEEKIKWAIKKNLSETFKVGDMIFVKQINKTIELKQYPKINGGIIAIDAFSGEVKALAGGFSFKSSEFNRVTQAKRQPGSALKPFVYAMALENGYAPNSIVLDAPYIAAQGVGLKDWKPENYGKQFYGPSTLRKGIEYSRNLMTVRVAESVGLDKILKLSKKLNIYDDIPELLSVSLGSAETTLIDLTSAYASFVNGGKKITPILVNKVQDRRGKTIFNSKQIECFGCDKFSKDSNEFPKIKYNQERVFSEETAYQIVSILEGAVKRGTGKKLRNLNVPIAGKTGTTNNNFDAWFVGFTSNLVIGVYVGFDTPKTLGKYETGSKAALPIFKDFVKKSIFKDEFKAFNIPKGIFFKSVDYDSGIMVNFGAKNSIVESFKSKDINSKNNNKLISNYNYDKLIKFRQFY